MRDELTINAATLIAPRAMIESYYPAKRVIHVFPDNAGHHHAKVVMAWLARPTCRIRLHYRPPYCPHLNPIERLWGLMHKHMTHKRCYSTFREFCTALLSFLRGDVPRNWRSLCDSVSDNFRVIDPDQFRVLT
ncbi:transposase [Skermanella aerolata]